MSLSVTMRAISRSRIRVFRQNLQGARYEACDVQAKPLTRLRIRDTGRVMSGARQPGAKPLYRPPVDDDAPPDLVEQAIIRALVPILVERIRARVTQEQPGRGDRRSRPARDMSYQCVALAFQVAGAVAP